ncbi:MAG: helix-hairpin-helix domain-containing protein [Deltaproteobacteria bacterium]|nr:helix-hairpin-helix domain-containing protein [Deltaproteobacteria bacterium]
MRTRHTVAITTILLVMLTVAVAHLRPPTPGKATPCPHPYVVDHEGLYSLVVCSDKASLPAHEVLILAGDFCAQANVKVATNLTLRAGQRLRVNDTCELQRGALGGPLRILLGLTIDINHAGAADLRALPRIGPALARRILRDRQRHGPFENLAALTRVRGIGPRTVAHLRGLASAR